MSPRRSKTIHICILISCYLRGTEPSSSHLNETSVRTCPPHKGTRHIPKSVSVMSADLSGPVSSLVASASRTGRLLKVRCRGACACRDMVLRSLQVQRTFQKSTHACRLCLLGTTALSVNFESPPSVCQSVSRISNSQRSNREAMLVRRGREVR